MCGIVGYKLYNTDRAHDAFKVFERLMIEAQVRGKHASGVSWVEGPTWQQGEVKTFKAPICAEALLETAGWILVLRHTGSVRSQITRDNLSKAS
jgi:hypothetical protein